MPMQYTTCVLHLVLPAVQPVDLVPALPVSVAVELYLGAGLGVCTIKRETTIDGATICI